VTRARLVLLALLLLTPLGCRQEMYDQPKYKDLRRSNFFDDRRQVRPLPDGTVARGFLREDSRMFAGRDPGGALVTAFPMSVDRPLLERGRQRYDIFCSPCHDRVGTGSGMIVLRGYRKPPSLHIDRLRTQADGYFFDVITNGYGKMPDYAVQVQPRDRWAIAAYIRALQLSQGATRADVPAGGQVAPQPPPGVQIMPPYDTHSVTTNMPAATATPSAVPASAGGPMPR